MYHSSVFLPLDHSVFFLHISCFVLPSAGIRIQRCRSIRGEGGEKNRCLVLTNDTTHGIRVKLNSWRGDPINLDRERAIDKIHRRLYRAKLFLFTSSGKWWSFQAYNLFTLRWTAEIPCYVNQVRLISRILAIKLVRSLARCLDRNSRNLRILIGTSIVELRSYMPGIIRLCRSTWYCKDVIYIYIYVRFWQLRQHFVEFSFNDSWNIKNLPLVFVHISRI